MNIVTPIFQKKTVLFFGLCLITFSSISQQIIYDNQLTKKDSVFYLKNSIYTGDVALLYANGQIKQRFSAIDGIAQDTLISYFLDSKFEKSKFLDTSITRELYEKIEIKKQMINSLIKDTIANRKRINNYIDNEIGGLKKLEKLKDKSIEADLNKKNQIKIDSLYHYENLNYQTLASLTQCQKEEENFQVQLTNELKKSVHNSKIELCYSHLNFIKNGFYKKYFETGKLEKEGYYTNDQKNGEWKEFDKNGDILLIDNYKFNVKDGLHKEFAGNIVIEEGTFTNALMADEWVFRYKDEKGNLKGKGSFNNGNGSDLGTTGIPKNGREGIWLLYHPNGKLNGECTYVNGKLEGLYKSYFENSVLESEDNYLNGEREGLCKFYYENGTFKSEENYKQGERNGICKFYHPNEKLHIAGDYLNGKLEGLCKTYYENGVLKSEENLKQSERNGICKFYHPNGKLKEEGIYLNGKINGLFKLYFDTGVLEVEGYKKQGESNGLCKFYHSNGKLAMLGNFINGKQDGLFKLYYPSGKLNGELNYVNGKLNGDAKEYNENGELKGEATYKDGTANNYLSQYIEKTTPLVIAEMKDQFLNGRTFTQKEYNEHYLCRYCRKVTINGWKNGYKADKNGYNSITDGYLLQAYSPKGLREMFSYCSPMCAKEDND